MKKILLCLLIPLGCLGQKKTYLLLGGTSNKGAMVGFAMQNDKLRMGIGGTIQLAGQSLLGVNNKYKGKNNANGRGVYYSCFDVSIGYADKDFSLQGEVSIGSQKAYENYINDGLLVKKYHQKTFSQRFVGFGGNIGISLTKDIEIFGGYNTVKKAVFGLRLDF